MKNKITNIITWVIIITILIFAFKFYQTNNFNEFVRSEANLRTSEFKRDKETKYSKTASYKIISNNENDAMFSKKVKVEKNTPYKVTCMVKTENVVPENEISGVGAQIAISGTSEKSIAITGTQDWQKIEMIFNSKNREEVDIGFRLGGYLGNCTGTAWFSDFTLEEGTLNESKNWKFACFIFENTDVIVNGKETKFNIGQEFIGNTNLAHGRIAACWAEKYYGIEDRDILNAIRYHTSARAGMSLLEKIIFVADAVEPGRTYPDAARLRKEAFDDLEGVYEFILKWTVDDLKQKGIDPGRDTIEAYKECFDEQ